MTKPTGRPKGRPRTHGGAVSKTLRMTHAENDAAKAAARAEGMPYSEWIRDQIRRGIKRVGRK